MAPRSAWSVAVLAAVSSLVAAADFPDCVNGKLASNKVCDTTLDAKTRAAALVAQFTLQEKIQNTGDKSPGVPRIGLPPYEWWSEALHGVARSPGVKFSPSGNFSYATSFPQPISLGAAFDMPLVRAVAETISTEARAFSNAGLAGLDYWTPNINPFRDPRWGRGQEVPSEDPFLISEYVKQLIPGLQGGISPSPYMKLVATCKHYAAYDMENWENHPRYGFDAQVTPSDMRDYYLAPFQACARDAQAGSFMCAYNAVNGIPSCADPWLLDTVLRQHWNWTSPDKYVTSDCDAVENAYADHHYGGTEAETAARSLKAGCDLDCGTFYPQHLGEAVDKGAVNASVLDASLVRRYASLVRLGYFDPAEKQPFRALAWKDVATAEARGLALRAAREGLVLLKNDRGTLPLGGKDVIKTIALVGPMTNATKQMQGNYYGIAQVVSPAAAFEKAGYTVIVARGAEVTSASTTGFAAAVDAAKKADAVVYLGGIDNSVETEERDRNEIAWPGAQLGLIKQLGAAAAGKPFVVVQMGTMVDSTEIKTNDAVGALLWAGYPGQDGGPAIVDVLTGVTAPAGRLPITQYPANYTKAVNMTDMSLRAAGDNPGRTYQWYTGKAVYPFGHGLHYTNFSASISSSPSSSLPSTFTTTKLTSAGSGGAAPWADLLPFATIPITVSNTGKVKSDFVALAFLKGEYGPKPWPLKSLVGFTRLSGIAPGASANGTIDVTLGSIARSDEKGNLVLWPGNYSIVVDIDEKAKWDFSISGEAKTLDVLPARS